MPINVLLEQSEQQHDTNRLHDAFIAAGLVPTLVASTTDGEESTFVFPDGTLQDDIDDVLAAYTYEEPPAPPDYAALLADVRDAADLAACKEASATLFEAILPLLGVTLPADTTPPTLISAVYVSPNIVATFSKDIVSPTPDYLAGWTLEDETDPVAVGTTERRAEDHTIVDFFIGEGFEGLTLTLYYDDATGDYQDLAGNPLESIVAGQAVTT